MRRFGRVKPQRLPRSDHTLNERRLVKASRRHGKLRASVEEIRRRNHPAGFVVEKDAERADLEDRLHALTDQFHDRLEVELARQRRADLVDQRELGVALPCLFDRAHTSQRLSDVLTDKGEQIAIRLGVLMILRVALHDHQAKHLPSRAERHAEP